MALMLAPQVVRMAARVAPYLTGIAGASAKDDLQHGAARVTNNNDQLHMQTSYEQDAKKIASLDSSKKLSEVRDFINELKVKWSPTSGPYYSRLMLGTCKALNSLDFGDKTQYELAYSNALEVLAQPHRLPDDPEERLEAETGLVLCLNHDLGDPSWNVTPSWQVRRRLNAEKFLSLWQRMRNEIDPNFDPEDRPLLNVPAPVGTGVTAGSDPATVADPAKRAKYQRAIQENRAKAKAYNLQAQLRTTIRVLEPHLKGYLIAAYAKEPANITELEGLLSQYQVTEPLKKDITEEIRKGSQ
jgi:hypothetical protein